MKTILLLLTVFGFVSSGNIASANDCTEQVKQETVSLMSENMPGRGYTSIVVSKVDGNGYELSIMDGSLCVASAIVSVMGNGSCFVAYATLLDPAAPSG